MQESRKNAFLTFPAFLPSSYCCLNGGNDLPLLFSLLGFLLALGVPVHGVEAGGAILAEIELRVGRFLGFFGKLSLQELPPSLVARSLNFPFQLAQDAFVLFHMSLPFFLPRRLPA